MNFHNENPQSAFALIKFFKEEAHYLSFKNGVSLFRTPHYYRTCEDIGRGDRHESCLMFWDRRFNENSEKLNFLKKNGIAINIKKLQSILIYPASEQYDSWMQSWAIIGPHNGFEHSLERMQKEFGYYFVLLPANKIKKYAKLVEQASLTKVNYGLVMYSTDPLKRSLTVKDHKFNYQKEYRFFTGVCSKDEVKDKFLVLKNINGLLMEAASLKLQSSSDVTTYCSVGGSGTVVVKK